MRVLRSECLDEGWARSQDVSGGRRLCLLWGPVLLLGEPDGNALVQGSCLTATIAYGAIAIGSIDWANRETVFGNRLFQRQCESADAAEAGGSFFL